MSAESPLDHRAQWVQGVDHQPGTSPDEQETEDSLDGSSHNLPGPLAHGCKANGGDDADEEGGNTEDLVDEELDNGQDDAHG